MATWLLPSCRRAHFYRISFDKRWVFRKESRCHPKARAASNIMSNEQQNGDIIILRPSVHADCNQENKVERTKIDG
jgi:hypothetical protein